MASQTLRILISLYVDFDNIRHRPFNVYINKFQLPKTQYGICALTTFRDYYRQNDHLLEFRVDELQICREDLRRDFIFVSSRKAQDWNIKFSSCLNRFKVKFVSFRV